MEIRIRKGAKEKKGGCDGRPSCVDRKNSRRRNGLKASLYLGIVPP